MEQKDIIEGNRLIAVFDGYREIKDYDGWEYAYTLHPKINVGCTGDMDLKYHRSWSHLMPVVEKIESLGKLVKIEGYVCEMTAAANEDPRLVPFKIKKHRNYKIQAVWEACIDFIRWHNQSLTDKK